MVCPSNAGSDMQFVPLNNQQKIIQVQDMQSLPTWDHTRAVAQAEQNTAVWLRGRRSLRIHFIRTSMTKSTRQHVVSEHHFKKNNKKHFSTVTNWSCCCFWKIGDHYIQRGEIVQNSLPLREKTAEGVIHWTSTSTAIRFKYKHVVLKVFALRKPQVVFLQNSPTR